MKNKMHIKTWQEGKFYVSQCLDVDVSSFGETKHEAIQNLEEALELYFEDLLNPDTEESDPLLIPRATFFGLIVEATVELCFMWEYCN